MLWFSRALLIVVLYFCQWSVASQGTNVQMITGVAKWQAGLGGELLKNENQTLQLLFSCRKCRCFGIKQTKKKSVIIFVKMQILIRSAAGSNTSQSSL